MKNKFISLFFAVMVVATLMTLPTFAAGWTLNGERWQFINQDDDAVTEDWKKSEDKWFYLDEDGFMSINKVIDYNEYFYFVDETGAMVTNTWKFVAINEDTDTHWMYFQTNGKAYKDGWYEINGKRYHFTDSIMDFGFLTDEGQQIKDEDDPWKTATYYTSTEADGARYTGWLKVDSMATESGYVWLYFGTNGKKYVDCVKVINGYKYGFDSTGAMLLEWAEATASTATGSNYYKEDTGLIKNAWFWDIKGDNDEAAWYYFDNNGKAYAGIVKTINTKRYSFDNDGKMLTGFVEVDDNFNVIGDAIAAEDMATSMLTSMAGGKYMYFTENIDPMLQGAAFTGKSVIEIKDGKVTINFNARGIAEADGYKVIKGYLYNNSVLVTPDEDHKYAIVEGKLINMNGKVCKKGTYTDPENEIRYIVATDGTIKTQHKDPNGEWIDD